MARKCVKGMLHREVGIKRDNFPVRREQLKELVLLQERREALLGRRRQSHLEPGTRLARAGLASTRLALPLFGRGLGTGGAAD